MSSMPCQASADFDFDSDYDSLSPHCGGSSYNISTGTDNTQKSSYFTPISDEHARIISVVVNCIAGLSLSLFGIAANIVNLCVFFKQGFSDSINVSFASLGIADLLALVTILGRHILYIPQIEVHLGLPIDPLPFSYLTAGWPHVYFLRVGCWITSFIAFKRCLCIVIPHKVKNFLTPHRVAIIHIFIYFIVFTTIAPLYYTNRLTWKFYADKNRTLIGLTSSKDREEIEGLLFPITTYSIVIGGLVFNVTCTGILAIKLSYHGRWRKNQGSVALNANNNNNNNNGHNVYAKENRVIKMTVTISTIYILCFLPHLVLIYYMTVHPDFRQESQWKNTYDVLTAFVTLVQTFNCSVNLCVYYHMSSKFKTTMLELFRVKVCLRK